MNGELYIPNPLPERDPKGKLLKGNSLAKGNTWDKIYDKATFERQKQRVSKMIKEVRGHTPTHSRKILCLTNNRIYQSQAQAARELFNNQKLSSHIAKCCKGKYRQVKGFKFEYYYED